MEGEALGHYQALIRFDTSATERAAAEYLKQPLRPARHPGPSPGQRNPGRPNVVARLKGSGRKRPLLLLGHLDTVTVDASKWTFPPFSATRDSGLVYGRGAIDDKDNLASAVMTMLLLKRQERGPRPRRHPAGRVGRGGRIAPRNGPLMVARALPGDRRRVLHRRRRRHDP